MHKYFDINEDGHSIRCKMYYGKDPRAVTHWVVATHGFGGDKDNKPIEKFAGRITGKYKGYGVVTFDWPAHGKDASSHLDLDESLDYLRLVTENAKGRSGVEKVYNYSTSMGGYFTLLSLHRFGNPYERVALRCPAIRFAAVMDGLLSDEDRTRLAHKGEVEMGFDRKITIPQGFLDDIAANDVSACDYLEWAERILVIHGTKDQMVPLADSEKFCDDNVVELIEVANADHPFTNPQYMDQAIAAVIDFFRP